MITLTPAYGRDYKSAKAAREDFDNDKDFILNVYPNHPLFQWDGKPVNREQLTLYPDIQIRYNKLRSVTAFRLQTNDTTASQRKP